MIEHSTRYLCDGCGAVIPDDTLYRVEFRSPSADLHFCDHTHVALWADREHAVRGANLDRAQAHRELHKALEAAGVDKDAYQTEYLLDPETGQVGRVTGHPVPGHEHLTRIGGSVESLSADEARAEIAKVNHVR